jgi:hypothetical protein
MGTFKPNPFATASFFAPLTSSLALTKGTGVATFTRATSATVMGYAPTAVAGDAQVLLTCAAGEARFEGARRVSQGVWSEILSDGTAIPAATLKGYLAEGAATNLCLQSNTFTSAPWVGYGSTVALAPSIVDPSGGANSYLLSAGAGAAYFLQSGNIAANNTRSIWMKAGTTPYVWLSGVYANNSEACFDLLLGVVQRVNGVGTTASMVAYPNGWYRCSLTSPTVDPYFYLVVSPKSFSGSLNAAVTTSACTCYIYGAQAELGATATSYIPTTTAAVTRNVDVLTYPSAGNMVGGIGAASVDMCTSGGHAIDTGRAVISSFVGAQGMPISGNFAGNNTVGIYDGVSYVATNISYGPLLAPTKVATTWSGTVAIASVQSGISASVAIVGMPISSFIGIGCWPGGNAPLGGNIKNVRLWTTQLTATQLVQITI